MNVMAVCNLSMLFTYVLPGAEGAASDPYVLMRAAERGFRVLEGKYLLGDAIYGQTEQFLVPYRSVRYHLREWADSGQEPANAQELFNLHHARLRNVIERTFAVLKRRWKILKHEFCESPAKLNKVVLACCALHNFIRLTGGRLSVVPLEYIAHVPPASSDELGLDLLSDTAATHRRTSTSTRWRYELAQRMWMQYVQYLHTQGRVTV